MRAGADIQNKPLPGLRDDLRLSRSADSPDGRQAWVIYDPLRHRYVQLDDLAFSVIRHWRFAANTGELLARAQADGAASLTLEDVDKIAQFLVRNELVESVGDGAWRSFAAKRLRHRQSLITRLLHNYLFLKIPLVRPDGFLRFAQPLVAYLSHPLVAGFAFLAAIFGLHLVDRQWADFTAAAARLFSLTGALQLFAAIVVVKAGHEFAHAFAAARRGLSVPSLGIAIILGMPMLYADVTDAWRLSSRRHRIAISLAGISFELKLAAFATLAWGLLPNSALRDLAFFIGVTSWVSSLLVNLNPFMRFDAYHVLADLLRVDNLQTRSFDLATWRLREILFALGAAPPEELRPALRRTLILYAWLTWIYRFFLFLGIALLVYSYFFKLLGLLLFAVEIGWFILRPLRHELGEWWKRRNIIVTRPRFYLTVTASGLAGLALLMPMSRSVQLQARIEPRVQAKILAPVAAEIAAIHVAHGMQVASGDLIFTLRSEALASERKLVDTKIELARLRLSRLAGDPKARAEQGVLASELASLQSRAEAIARELADLVIRAPVAGTIVEIDRRLHAGRHVGRKEPLAILAASDRWIARGYVDESDVPRLATGAAGVFIADDALRAKLPLRLETLSVADSAKLDIEMLTETRGGTVPSVLDASGRVQSLNAVYLALFGMLEAPAAAGIRRGWIHVEGEKRSLVDRLWRHALMVLVRESGA